jgi:hypothetical protein
VRDDFKHSAYGIPGAQRVIHFGLHAVFRLRISTVQQHLVLCMKLLQFFPWYFGIGQSGFAYRDHMAKDVDSKLTQKKLGQRSHGYPPGRFAR